MSKPEEQEHPLLIWLKAEKITRTAFAERIGYSQSVVSAWINGVKTPRLEAAKLVERETAGKVSAAVMMGL